MDLHHPIHDMIGHGRARQLGHRELMARVTSLVRSPRGHQHQPARALQLDVAVGDHRLDHLVLADRLAECPALARVVDRHLQQPLSRADRLRGDHVASTADPLHGQLEAVADLTQHVAMRNTHIDKRH